MFVLGSVLIPRYVLRWLLKFNISSRSFLRNNIDLGFLLTNNLVVGLLLKYNILTLGMLACMLFERWPVHSDVILKRQPMSVWAVLRAQSRLLNRTCLSTVGFPHVPGTRVPGTDMQVLYTVLQYTVTLWPNEF